ncbi:hypothetical protein ACWD25_26500 [Streptomyces sp. NPDC002920]
MSRLEVSHERCSNPAGDPAVRLRGWHLSDNDWDGDEYLLLFFVLQRKAWLLSKQITVTEADEPAVRAFLGGDCQCGRGQTIGTCIVTASRLWFRAFHDGPAAYHLARCTDWACVDCIADNALAVATGEVRATLRRIAAERRATNPA